MKSLFSVLIAFLALILLIQSIQVEGAIKCRALSLGGGGDRGAYEAGVIKALVELQSPEKVRYEVVTGISAGAINTAAFAQFKIGDEVAAKDFLVERWKKTKKEDIYKNWSPGGVVEGFFLKSGLFDHTPLKNYISKYVDPQKLRSSGRNIAIGASNIAKNEFVHFDENSPHILEAVRASSSIPGIFPMVEIDGEYYVDGGQQYMTPVTSAIQKCIERYPGENVEVTVDVILAISDAELPSYLKYNITPFVLIQSLFGIVKNIFVKDIANAKIAFPQAQIRVFKPSQWLPGVFLFFDNTDKILDIGFNDAAKLINTTMITMPNW